MYYKDRSWHWRSKNDKICEKWKQEDWLRTQFRRKVAWYPSTFLRLFGNRSFLSWRNAQLASTAAATSLLSVSPFCSQLFLALHPVLRAWLSCALPVVNFNWVPYLYNDWECWEACLLRDELRTMGNTCVGSGCCNPNSNGSGTRKPLDKPFTDPSPGTSTPHLFESKYSKYIAYFCS